MHTQIQSASTQQLYSICCCFPSLLVQFQSELATAGVQPATWLHVAGYSGHNNQLMTNNLGIVTASYFSRVGCLLQNILKPLPSWMEYWHKTAHLYHLWENHKPFLVQTSLLAVNMRGGFLRAKTDGFICRICNLNWIFIYFILIFISSHATPVPTTVSTTD